MLKNILNIEGVQKLSKSKQQKFLGGIGPGFCYMPNNETCCCFFEDRRDFICANGQPVRPGFGCVYA